MDKEGWTPLHYASYFGHRVIIDRLITLGADVNIPDAQYGKLAYDYADEALYRAAMMSLANAGTNSEKAQACRERAADSLREKAERLKNPGDMITEMERRVEAMKREMKAKEKANREWSRKAREERLLPEEERSLPQNWE